MQIAIVNKSSRLDDGFLAYAAKACDAQVIECAQAWGIDPTPVAFYAKESDLPARNCRVLVMVDDIDVPGAGGYHTFEVGVVYARVLVSDANGTSVTLSHECLEELVDPYCNVWRSMGGGRSVALEVCDPCQADEYAVPVTIMDRKPRQIMLSNYVLPKWFEPAALGQFDRMGAIKAPFTMSEGGYLIVRDDRTGDEDNVFARPRLRMQGTKARLSVANKLMNGEARLARRLAA